MPRSTSDCGTFAPVMRRPTSASSSASARIARSGSSGTRHAQAAWRAIVGALACVVRCLGPTGSIKKSPRVPTYGRSLKSPPTDTEDTHQERRPGRVARVLLFARGASDRRTSPELTVERMEGTEEADTVAAEARGLRDRRPRRQRSRRRRLKRRPPDRRRRRRYRCRRRAPLRQQPRLTSPTQPSRRPRPPTPRRRPTRSRCRPTLTTPTSPTHPPPRHADEARRRRRCSRGRACCRRRPTDRR